MKKIFFKEMLAALRINLNQNQESWQSVKRDIKGKYFFKINWQNLIKFKPQKNWLYLIGTYKNYALNYFFLSFHSRWCWGLKVSIDRNFINNFRFTTN